MYLSELSIVFTLSAVITFIMAYLSTRFPAIDGNGILPYKTPQSMRSQHAWDFAQRVQPRFQLVAGFFQLGAAVLFTFLPQPSLLISCLLIGIVIMASFLFVVVGVETRLKMARKHERATS